ncbi:MAG: bestrophin-like domain [Gammaproteobacteria bacterium]
MEQNIIEWLYALPISWMAALIFGITFFLTGVIYVIVAIFAAGERAKAFKSISAGMLPPLGVMYGLFVTIIASQVWANIDKANTAVYREASALSTTVFLAASFPGEPEERIRTLIRRHIHDAVTHEWPIMAYHTAKLKISSQPLAEALQLTLRLKPRSEGQTTAQKAIVNALEDALDARRQRIVISLSDINWITWMCLIMQAICTLMAIAMIHCGNRIASTSAMGIFATGVSVSVLIIVAHNRPFGGPVFVDSALLTQIESEEMLSQLETNQAIALRLTTLLDSARKVIADHQDLINQPSSGKSLTADQVIAETLSNYVKATGHLLTDLDSNSAEGMILQAELDAIADVIDKAQPLFNDPDLGYKSFPPAIFTDQVAQSFNKKVSNLAYLKFTAPQELIRLKSNRPDKWEDKIIESRFQSPTWKKGELVAEVAELNGKKAFRLMIPKYYDSSCLEACHGGSNETSNSTKKKTPVSKVGDLGGAISAAIYIK